MTDGDTGVPRLVLGPLLRYVGENEATIWVETDRACQVEVLGHQARTFEVSGHHYGLVVIGDLRPGAEYEYQVALDGTVRWPEPDSDFPPSVLRTPDLGRPLRLSFGSCRIAELPVVRRRTTGSSAIRQEPKESRSGRPRSGVRSTLGGKSESGSGQRTVPSSATWYSYSAPGRRSPITTSP